jgi:CheY-like chemotaxis protein
MNQDKPANRAEETNGAPSILLVDDEVRLLSVNKRLLTALGMEVRTAESGPEALEVLREWSPDLVLLDMVMPRMDGVTTLRRLRMFSPDQKVIFLSAYSDQAQIMEAESLGALAYLQKPAPLEVMTRVIEAALRGEKAPGFRVKN